MSTQVILLSTLTGLAVGIFGQSLDNRPVIGILSQESLKEIKNYGDEYISAIFVKYLEMAGARVVAIKGNQPESYYSRMFQSVNGILLPSGNVSLSTSMFARSSRLLFKMAIDANNNGDFFPIWGTCQGLQMLTVLITRTNLLIRTDSDNISLPLDFMPDYRSCRLFSRAPPRILRNIAGKPVTVHSHHWSMLEKTFTRTPSLTNFYRIVSTNEDRHGVTFVSTLEAIRYPFYGVQWHPEKNIFLWRADTDVDHEPYAIEMSQYMANFFVNEARKSFHRFPSQEEESNSIVENDVYHFFQEKMNGFYFYNVTED